VHLQLKKTLIKEGWS